MVHASVAGSCKEGWFVETKQYLLENKKKYFVANFPGSRTGQVAK